LVILFDPLLDEPGSVEAKEGVPGSVPVIDCLIADDNYKSGSFERANTLLFVLDKDPAPGQQCVDIKTGRYCKRKLC
jgi:hypothetical protein